MQNVGGEGSWIYSSSIRRVIVEKIIQYISQPAGRHQVMAYLGVFSVVGAMIVSAVLLGAAFVR
jgi:hypothetical protein